MRKAAFMALIIGATAAFAACSPGAAPGLTDKQWNLTAITEKVPAFQGVVPPADQGKYAITFKTDLTWNGSADCNQIAGTYKTPGSNSLTIEVGVSTLAFCPEASLDTLFVHGLARAKTYGIVNDVLTITLDDEGTLVFGVAPATSPSAAASGASSAAAATPTTKPTPKPTAKPTTAPTTKPTAAPTAKPGASATPSPATGLIGKVWQLTAITEKDPAFQGVVPDAQQSNYTITFAADATFSAKADCNTVSGTYTTASPAAASGDLAIIPGGTTSAACPEGSLADLYVLGLSNAASYAIAGSQLTITLADQGTLTFK
jgi:heat shock protein HslJ